jgi:hypothetical protein
LASSDLTAETDFAPKKCTNLSEMALASSDLKTTRRKRVSCKKCMNLSEMEPLGPKFRDTVQRNHPFCERCRFDKRTMNLFVKSSSTRSPVAHKEPRSTPRSSTRSPVSCECQRPAAPLEPLELRCGNGFCSGNARI